MSRMRKFYNDSYKLPVYSVYYAGSSEGDFFSCVYEDIDGDFEEIIIEEEYPDDTTDDNLDYYEAEIYKILVERFIDEVKSNINYVPDCVFEFDKGDGIIVQNYQISYVEKLKGKRRWEIDDYEIVSI